LIVELGWHGLVESRMRGNAHVRFGGRAGETDRRRRRHRASARPYLAQEALDELRRHDWQQLRRADPERARWLKGTRFILRRRADALGECRRSLIEDLAETNERVYRGWLLLERLRAVYRLSDGAQATRPLDEWIHAAATSGLGPFVRVAITFEEHAAAICAAIALRLSNARLEAMTPLCASSPTAPAASGASSPCWR
jgi:transposase